MFLENFMLTFALNAFSFLFSVSTLIVIRLFLLLTMYGVVLLVLKTY